MSGRRCETPSGPRDSAIVPCERETSMMEGVRVPLAIGTPPRRRRRMTMDKIKMMVLQ